MLGIRCDMSLPKILQVVVVGRRSTSFNLGENSSSWRDPIEEVRSRASDETILRCQNDLFVEAEVRYEERRKVVLDRQALRSVNVQFRDLRGRQC